MDNPTEGISTLCTDTHDGQGKLDAFPSGVDEPNKPQLKPQYVGPVTWTQLREEFGMEVIAEGCTLKGMIVFREDEYWLRGLSKTFRLRDTEGVEQQVTIAANRGVQKKQQKQARGTDTRDGDGKTSEEEEDEEDDEEPVLTPEEENDLRLGAVVEILSPRLHHFLDGEEGSVVYSANDIRVVEKASPATLTVEEKLRMGEAMKAKGNAWMAKKENHRAKTNYQGALNLLNTVTTADALAGVSASEGKDTARGAGENEGEKEKQRRLRQVEEARVLQSACGSNLMLIAIQEREWNVAIKSGEEILAHGVRGGVRSKVLYRMALAFEKLGSMEVAMEYALKAKDAASQAGIQAPEVDTLYQRLFDETTGRRYLGGLRHLAWGQAHHLEGMHPRFGYRAPLLGDPREAKEMAEVLVDASVCLSAVPSTSNASATSSSRLKPRLLYICEHTPFTAPEARYMEDVLRIKTVVYLHTGLLPASRGALSVSHPLLAFSGFSVPPQVVSARSSARSSCVLPVSADERVVVNLDLVPLLVPYWFYCVLSALVYVGLFIVAQAALRFYLSMRYRAGSMVQALQRSPEVLAVIAQLLARPQNYPVAFCSDFPSAEYGPNDVAFAAFNSYKKALMPEDAPPGSDRESERKGTGRKSGSEVWSRDVETARSFLLEK